MSTIKLSLHGAGDMQNTNSPAVFNEKFAPFKRRHYVLTEVE